MLAKPKKPNRTQLKKKCDILASQYYRALTPYCEAADRGTGINCGGNLQWCHIVSRSVLHIRYEPYNNLVLCQGHHRAWTTHPLDFIRFLEKHYPERLQLAEANRYKFAKVDYEAWIGRFNPSSE